MTSTNERDYIRELARKIVEIAGSPENETIMRELQTLAGHMDRLYVWTRMCILYAGTLSPFSLASRALARSPDRSYARARPKQACRSVSRAARSSSLVSG